MGHAMFRKGTTGGAAGRGRAAHGVWLALAMAVVLPGVAQAQAQGRTAGEAALAGARSPTAGRNAVAPAPLAPELGPTGLHVVRSGESLLGIARRYGRRPADLARLNGLSPASVLLPGQQLWVPLAGAVDALAGAPAVEPPVTASAADVAGTVSEAAVPAPAADASGSEQGRGQTYLVAPGDTLYGLARRFAVPLEDLKRWNSLPADGSLRAGETLWLTGPAPGARAAPAAAVGGATRDVHVVQPGDTLTSIALRYGTTAGHVQRDNSLSGDLIVPGQRLVVPRSGSGAPGPTAAGAKRIEVAVGEQRMHVWQGDTLVWSWLASTGIASHPTRRGTFAVQSKIPEAWSSAWQLSMPHWLGIYWAGSSENGIHALPIINGQRLWAGSLGSPVSYGCVVLGVREAELLYHWAEIGTPVVIRD